jgi:hypothetical protein
MFLHCRALLGSACSLTAHTPRSSRGYLDAASGLAHLYIGFAELARAAVRRTPPTKTL